MEVCFCTVHFVKFVETFQATARSCGILKKIALFPSFCIMPYISRITIQEFLRRFSQYLIFENFKNKYSSISIPLKWESSSENVHEAFHVFRRENQVQNLLNTGLFISPSGISNACGTVAGMVTPKGSISTEGETLQVSVIPYRCSICAVATRVAGTWLQDWHLSRHQGCTYRAGRTETWSVSPSVEMIPFGVTIPATVPRGSEIPEGLMNNAVYCLVKFNGSTKIPLYFTVFKDDMNTN
jgi:hypothetical protein